MREMDPDLMRAAGQELGLEQREWRIVIAPGLDASERRRSIATEVVIDAHAPLAFACRELVQREAHGALLVAPITLHQHEIALVDFAIAQLAVKLRQRRTALGNDQQP